MSTNQARRNAYFRAYYHQNKEKIKAIQKLYYEKNKDKRKQKSIERYHNDPDYRQRKLAKMAEYRRRRKIEMSPASLVKGSSLAIA